MGCECPGLETTGQDLAGHDGRWRPANLDAALQACSEPAAEVTKLRTADSGCTHATIAANQRRIRRLLGALDDLANYPGPLPRNEMLAQAWSRLSAVLLLHAADLEGACCQHDSDDKAPSAAKRAAMAGKLRQAVARVSAAQMGSHRWWLTVHDVAELCSRDLACESEAAWSADP
jgi:hypothetical protein